jgi:hypothetical protein
MAILRGLKSRFEDHHGVKWHGRIDRQRGCRALYQRRHLRIK